MTLSCVARDEGRLAALRRYDLLDTPAEEAFDRLTRMAKRALGTPVALLSLIDANRQWFKACDGLDVSETSLDVSFCLHAAAAKAPLAVPDARLDARFRDNPLVTGAPGIRAYAGAPLVTPDGYALGSLCVVDTAPRQFSPAELELLRDLAAEASDQLELRLTRKQHRDLFATHPQPMLVYDCASLRILDVNEAACERYGYTREAFLRLGVDQIRPAQDVPRFRAHLKRRGSEPGRSGPWRHVTARGETLHAFVDAFPITYDGRAARIIHIADASAEVRMQQALEARERLREGELEALRMTAQDAPLDAVLAHVTRLLETQLPGSRCSVVLLDASRKHVCHAVGPSIPDAYFDALRGAAIGPKAGSCGTAAYTGSAVVTEDIETDPLWEDFRDLVRPFGMRACHSVPIVDRRGRALGTFAVYYDAPRPLVAAERAVIDAAAHLAQVAIERTHNARALLAADARHRALIDAVSALVWTAGSDGRFAPDVVGWQAFAGDAVPAPAEGWLALVHPGDRPGAKAAWDAARAEGTPLVTEHRLRRRDGTYRTMAAYAVPLRDAAGETAEWVGVHFDVTAQRRAEAALHASEERFRLVAERMTDVVSLQRPDGQYVWVSPSVEHVFGYTPDELLALSPEQLVHPEDWPGVAAATLEAIMGTGEHFEVTCRLRHHGGHYVWMESRGRLVRDRDGRVTAMQLISRDITERRRYEAELVDAREDALEAARLKSALLANMSHEIRTPLTGIIGFADLLADAADDDTREFAERIAASGQRLMDTLNSVLDLAQLEAGALRFEPVPVDLAAEIRGVASLLHARAAARGLALTLDLPAAPLLALGDRAAIGRVLANLAGNAIKFTEAGTVAFEARAAGDGAVEVRVRDTGVGISPEFLPRLFREFEQESHGHGRRFEGSGLGLAITRRLVELMEGTVAVESTPGKGTTFTVRLRSAPPAPAAQGDGAQNDGAQGDGASAALPGVALPSAALPAAC